MMDGSVLLLLLLPSNLIIKCYLTLIKLLLLNVLELKFKIILLKKSLILYKNVQLYSKMQFLSRLNRFKNISSVKILKKT